MDKSSGTSESKTTISDFYLLNQSLLGLVNRVIVAGEAADLAGLKPALLDLQTETNAHFAREERLMTECQYEASAQHETEHRLLSGEIQHQIDELDAGRSTVSFIGRDMQNWILRHIVSQDSVFVISLLTQIGSADRRPRSIEKDVDRFEERPFDNPRPIHWAAKYEVGVEVIDADHRAIISLLSDIVDARKSADKTRLAALLELLGNETATHFENEEKLMSECNYQRAAEHQEEHRKLLDEYAHQVDEYRNNSISAELLCRFIYRWFLRHIEISDIPLCETIRRQNAAS